MKRLVLVFGVVLLAALLIVLAHLAFIEVGREVVTLRTRRTDGSWQSTRLWVVDHDGAVWLHSAGAAWAARFEGDPEVELERAGRVRRYRARIVRGAHADIDAALREKYGLADRWVRLISPCDEATLPVRLDPLEP